MTDRPQKNGISGMAAGLITMLKRLERETSGMGAVEFAIIMPLLLMLYITAFEITIGLSVSKRATRSAGAIADLVTQSDTPVTKTSLGTMSDVASAIFAPYSTRNMTLEITGIKVDNAGKATVNWSWAGDNSAPHKKNAAFTLPSDIATPNSFLVHARVSVPHQILMFMPGLIPPEMNNITIRREYYFRERIENAVTCTDCPSG